MLTVALQAQNNEDFSYIKDLTNFAAVYNLTNSVIRAQMRPASSSPVVLLKWCTPNGNTDGHAAGLIDYDAATKVMNIFAPASVVRKFTTEFLKAQNGTNIVSFDVRVETPTGQKVVIIKGTIAWDEGDTR